MFYSKIHSSGLLTTTSISPLPSEKWKNHLRDYFNSLLRGEEKRKAFFLFSADPGLGKTREIISFLREYNASGFKAGGSIILFLSRLREIDTIVAAAGLGVSDFAVVSSDADMNSKGLGASCANKARVLFTTQQMLYARMGDKSFADMTEFWFDGAPRSLRIWDETITPAKDITVREDFLNSLPAALRTEHPVEVRVLDDLLASIDAMPINGQDVVSGSLSADLAPIMNGAAFDTLSGHLKEALRRLLDLSGRPFGMAKDNRHGKVLVGAGRRFPKDLAPMIVLDASGSVRTTYDLWEKEGAQLVRLPTVRATYENLKVRIWEYGSGKSTLKDKDRRAPVIAASVDLLNGDDEPWLIVHHKDADASIAAEIIAKVKRSERVGTIHWGDHHGINTYRDIRKVLVIGIMTYPSYAYQALHMAAGDGLWASVNPAACAKLKRGEMRHNLLQGISRCNVRNHSADRRCGKATVYVIASKGHRPKALITETFPGAVVKPWEPLPPVFKGHAVRVMDELLRQLDSSPCGFVTKRSIYEAVGIKGEALAKIVRKTEFQRWLKDTGIRVDHFSFALNPKTIGV